MIGLRDGWDDDLYGDSFLKPPPSTSGGLHAKLPTASELLQRAEQAAGKAVVVKEAASPAFPAAEIALAEKADVDMPATGAATLEERPAFRDLAMAMWAAKAPRDARLSQGFRCSLRGGMLAQPVRSKGGGFRVRLLQLAPKAGSCPVDGGAALLEAGKVEEEPGGARSVPGQEGAQRLMAAYVKSAGSLEPHGKEALELLRALSAKKGSSSSGVGSWLSSVNVKTVKEHLERKPAPAPLKDAERQEAARLGLKRVYHLLTANSVSCALRELGKVAGGDGQFERLAAILGASGGSSIKGRERRQWLRQQVLEWRCQGVHKLMDFALWRIYCLLGGEHEELLSEALDWRTAFGMFVWYGCPAKISEFEEERLATATRLFEEALASHDPERAFQPLRIHGSAMQRLLWRSAEGSEREESSVRDLHFALVRAAAGLAGWGDLANFDYRSRSRQPLDVAVSWHVSLLVQGLFGVSSDEDFQRLTQQYCFLLEALGKWRWALYVAHFIADRHARWTAVQGLLTRHCLEATAPGEQRAVAARHEAEKEWLPAVSAWLAAGESERAVRLAMAFLQPALLAGHMRRGEAQAVHLSEMAPPARWLLEVYTRHEKAAAAAGGPCLAFMTEWAAKGEQRCDAAHMAKLLGVCRGARQRLLGAPW